MIGKKEVMQKFIDLWRGVRNQKYSVFRGAVNWPNHDFNKQPYCVAVMMDECSFLGEINDGVVSFEIFAPIVKERKINDAELEVQLLNVLEVLYEFGKSKNKDGRSVGTILPNSERCIEHYDSSLNVQGLVILFSIKF